MSVTKIKQTWISVNLIMIIMMIIIGGITRLTDSGLSMTEWNLIGGIIPPLNQGDWLELFSKYKDTPEFIQKNFDISLSEFKKIFFWEYFHRIWGRLIGITYTLPFLFFFIKGMFDSNEKKIYTILLFLGSFQAFMGWFMVQSGLSEKPDVSHFRLSAHLIIAFIIYSILLDRFCKNMSYITEKPNYFTTKYNRQINNIKISIFLVLLTVGSGAFVSGTNAGWAYNNFPYMGENFLPPIFEIIAGIIELKPPIFEFSSIVNTFLELKLDLIKLGLIGFIIGIILWLYVLEVIKKSFFYLQII